MSASEDVLAKFVTGMDGRKASVLPFSIVVDERWDGKCSRNELCLYPLPYTLYTGEATDVGFVEVDEGTGRRAIG